MKRIFPALAALFLSCPVSAATIAEARAAYTLYDVSKAEAIYRTIASDPAASPKDRAVSNRELARIAWLVDADGVKAISFLEASLSNNPDPCPAALLYGRILNDGVGQEAAAEKLAPYASKCLEIEPETAIEHVRASLLAAQRENGGTRVRLAKDALAEWRSLPRGLQVGHAGSRLHLQIGITANMPSEALAGWRDYFWLERDKAAPQAFKQSDEQVRAAFSNGLTTKPETTGAVAFAHLLMRAGFYDELQRYVKEHDLARRAPADRWKKFQIYMAMHDRFDATILAHDRRFARSGPSDEDGFKTELGKIYDDTLTALGKPAGKPFPALYEEFGLWGEKPGITNGVAGILLGHVVVDGRLEIKEGGRTGSIRYISVDTMIHNSFSTWLEGSGSGVGGWAVEGSTIVQVRPSYLSGISAQALLVRSGPARDRALSRIVEERTTDREIAKRDPGAYLPGTGRRLRMQGLDALAAAVRAELKAGEDFGPRFVKALYETENQSSIILHEGRHVLDQAQFKGEAALSPPELEFRAKLSEIRLAKYPRLAIQWTYSSLLSGPSSHAVANRRIVDAYILWIKAHRGEINGYDPAYTELEQLDKLSDDQLRAVVRALDPAIVQSKI